MTRIDDDLRAALSDEDRALLDRLDDEPGVFELWRASYQGKFRWLNLIATVFSVAIFAGQIWCLVELLTTDDAVLAVRWAAGFGFCALAVAMLKMWFWMRMNHLAAVREIKKIELLLASADHKPHHA
tara:strand:+ start:1267 stop:1647 length:381 start_codon:yes stop_codon:yes gene_type:complete